MEKLWTTAEVAAFLGIEEPDVEALVRQGQLTGYRLGGQFLRFRPDQVEMLKGRVAGRVSNDQRPPPGKRAWIRQLRDLVYLYDFYVISFGLLAVLVLYLIVSG